MEEKLLIAEEKLSSEKILVGFLALARRDRIAAEQSCLPAYLLLALLIKHLSDFKQQGDKVRVRLTIGQSVQCSTD